MCVGGVHVCVCVSTSLYNDLMYRHHGDSKKGNNILEGYGTEGVCWFIEKSTYYKKRSKEVSLCKKFSQEFGDPQ